jgi:rSAM/selenodomain-associated transferase 1
VTELAVLVMARTPRAGAVKTRLEPLLGPHGCAGLQAALLDHAIRLARAVAPDGTYLALDTPLAGTELVASEVRLLIQRGADLGARMRHALDDVWGGHDGPVAVIGTDAPTLREAHLYASAAALDAADVVFGPALDGGYYLIGLCHPAPEVLALDPRLWGGHKVLAASLAAARRAELRTASLEPLRDLDTPDDARAHVDSGELPAEIASLLATPAVPT